MAAMADTGKMSEIMLGMQAYRRNLDCVNLKKGFCMILIRKFLRDAVTKV